MATPYPPPPPQPPRQNNAVLAVVLGIVIVLGVMVAFGVFVAARLIHDTHITQNNASGRDSVEIHSPLGDLHVDGSGDHAKVDIRSPFGNLKVNSAPDPSRLDIPVYPGAAIVTSRQHSPFQHGDLGRQGDWDTEGNSSTGAQVQLSSGSAVLNLDVVEFCTSATPGQVLDFYDRQFGALGSVQRQREDSGAMALKLKLSDKNVREAVIKPGDDGTHFVLIRVLADSGAK